MAMVEVVNDNFTRADVNPLGGNWSIPTNGGNGGNRIVSNKCEPTSALGVYCCSYWSATILAPSGTFPADQYSEVTASSLHIGSGNNYDIAAVRITSGGTGPNAYMLLAGKEAGGSAFYLFKRVNGTNTTLVARTAITINDGDVFRLSVTGTSLTFTQNGTGLTGSPLTDSAVASGQPGLFQFTDNGTIGFAQIGLWAAGANQATTPTFSPVAGAYGPTQTVTITGTASSTIYYTTDGSTPTESSSSIASGATISVAATETVKAISSIANMVDSAVGTAAYTINGAVATSTFSPVAGSYGPAQSVTLSNANSALSGFAQYYTTDGSTPTTGSTLYSGAITVTSSQTIKVLAVATNYSNSAVASAAYTITGTATPTFSPTAGTYTQVQNVTISDTDSGLAGYVVYYTTDGSTPTNASTLYTGPVRIGSSLTLKALANTTSGGDSAVGSAAYVINIPAPSNVSGGLPVPYFGND